MNAALSACRAAGRHGAHTLAPICLLVTATMIALTFAVLVEFLPMMLGCSVGSIAPGLSRNSSNLNSIKSSTKTGSVTGSKVDMPPSTYSLDDVMTELQSENTELRERVQQLREDLALAQSENVQVLGKAVAA
jgi:hypothetical protein